MLQYRLNLLKLLAVSRHILKLFELKALLNILNFCSKNLRGKRQSHFFLFINKVIRSLGLK